MADDLDEMLTTMEQDDVLARLDSILQEKRFSGVASRGVCIGIRGDRNARASGNELSSALLIRYKRFYKLVRQKMPHSHARGILRYVF